MSLFTVLCITILAVCGWYACGREPLLRQSALLDVVMLWRAGRMTADQAVNALMVVGEYQRAFELVDPLYEMPPDVFMRVLHRRLRHAQTTDRFRRMTTGKRG